MTFEQWWAQQSFSRDDLSLVARNAWNAALDATQEMLLTCCCGHMRAEHDQESFSCKHENCTCLQLCDCWIVVSEMAESEHPGTLKKHFDPLYAKQTFALPKIGMGTQNNWG